jgi:hypothetical protein
MTKRTAYFMGFDDVAAWINGGYQRMTGIRRLGDAKSHYSYWDGFSIKNHWAEMNGTETHPMDVCDFDYYHFSGNNFNAEISTVHNQLINKFLAHNFTAVYVKDNVVILRNLNRGAECLE